MKIENAYKDTKSEIKNSQETSDSLRGREDKIPKETSSIPVGSFVS